MTGLGVGATPAFTHPPSPLHIRLLPGLKACMGQVRYGFILDLTHTHGCPQAGCLILKRSPVGKALEPLLKIIALTLLVLMLKILFPLVNKHLSFMFLSKSTIYVM